MRISVKEFQDLMESHSREMRQMQDDFNLIADEKDDEIKELNDKLDSFRDAFKEFKDKVRDMATPDVQSVIEQAYINALDGLDGY